jgi:hypothetical protein
MYFVDNGNRHDETYSAVRRKGDDDGDYTLYHHKIHTHTKQTDAKRREKKSRESDTHRT